MDIQVHSGKEKASVVVDGKVVSMLELFSTESREKPSGSALALLFMHCDWLLVDSRHLSNQSDAKTKPNCDLETCVFGRDLNGYSKIRFSIEDWNISPGEKRTMFVRSRDVIHRKIIYSVPVLNRKPDFGVSI